MLRWCRGTVRDNLMVKVMSFNIRASSRADDLQGVGWRVRRERVMEVIAHHSPDILGVQEALQAQIQHLRQGLSDYDYYGLGRDDGRSGGEYSALFFRRDRFKRMSTATLWLSESPDRPSIGWDAGEPRIATRLELEDLGSGTNFWVWNTHLDHRGETARQRGACLLRDFIDGHLEPAVVLADLNCLPYSAPYQMLTHEEFLLDAFDCSETEPQGPESTFRGLTGVPRRGARQNFIFVTPEWRVLTYSTATELFETLPLPSDHYPVVAEIDLIPEAGPVLENAE